MNNKDRFLLSTKSVWQTGMLVLCALILASCQAAPTVIQVPATIPLPTTTIAPSASPTLAVSTEAVINVAIDPKLGKILVDEKGMTLYVFTKDGPDKSNCSGDCLKKWPPLLTLGTPMAGAGVDPSLIGTAALSDGSKIVTYNKMPLYYWVNDTKSGDTNGEGVGSVWFVVSPDGTKVDVAKEATVSPTQTAVGVTADVTIGIVTDPKLGKILVDGKGMTLYAFANDGPDKSNCSGDCLKKWPPLLTLGSPMAGAGVDASLIGIATLSDGSKIVTYNKMPLYYWVNDTKPGDTNGEGIGSVWFVVSPDGKPVSN